MFMNFAMFMTFAMSMTLSTLIHSSSLGATTALLYQAYCGDEINAALLESYIRLFSNNYNTWMQNPYGAAVASSGPRLPTMLDA